MQHRGQLLIWMLLVVLVLAGCGGATTPTTESPENTAENATEAEEAENAANDSETGIEEQEAVTGELTFSGSTTVQPLVEQIGVVYRETYPNVALNIAAGGSGVGIQAIQNGDVDIGMASRTLKEGEQTEGMEVYQIAVDVLAVIVHPSNPVKEITREQLQDIFTGQITNWSEVGGPDEVIQVVIREETSGTRGAFDEIALEDEQNTPDAETLITAGEVEQFVANTENAIGYIGFGHVAEAIKVLKIDGVSPSPETAQDGTYQLQRPLQLLTGPLSRDLAQTFVEFALSSEGQEIVEMEGWVSVE